MLGPAVFEAIESDMLGPAVFKAKGIGEVLWPEESS